MQRMTSLMMDLQSEACPEGFWPVYKGASFDLWTPDTGDVLCVGEPGTGARPSSGQTGSGEGSGRIRGVRRGDGGRIRIPSRVWDRGSRFRDVTNRTNRRTVIAALVPPRVFLTNAAPYLLWPRGMERDQAYLLGVLSSLALDWYARRFVETHVNFFVLNPFPVPGPDEQSLLRDRVIALAGRLAAPDDRFSGWAERLGIECGPLEAEERRTTSGNSTRW